MPVSPVEFDSRAVDVTVTADRLVVALADGRELKVPLTWFPRLVGATERQRDNWRLIGSGHAIHWPDVDEDVSVANILGRA